MYLIGERAGHGELLNKICDKFKFLDCIYTEDFPSYRIFGSNRNSKKFYDKQMGKYVMTVMTQGMRSFDVKMQII